ncbi:unnamed protein product, partial [Iphiclides podalirius]
MASVLPWNCCRTCLSQQSLHPIFAHPQHSEKYSNLILIAAGVKVVMDDTLPQVMCSVCIAYINGSRKFRRRCEDAQKLLAENKPGDIKLEQMQLFKIEYENATQIDIAECSHDDDFKDYDDNVTLDTLQCNYESDKVTDQKEIKDPTDQEPRWDDANGSITLASIKSKKTNVKMKPERIKSKPVREPKKAAKKQKNDTKQAKEAIECEYCHKVLTSKLSLRNHYKIHTGFDVVCEHCGKKFITRRLLLMHCRAKHGYEKTDKCSFCDYRASNAEQVKIHERLHTGERPFVCGECGAGFHRRSSYLQHVAIHLPEKTVQCGQCPARFKSHTLMRIHAQRHLAPRYAFRCGACAGTFARRRNVARHLQRVHSLPPDQRHIERLQLR